MPNGQNLRPIAATALRGHPVRMRGMRLFVALCCALGPPRSSAQSLCSVHSECSPEHYCDADGFCYSCSRVSPASCPAIDRDCCSTQFLAQCPSDPHGCAFPPAPQRCFRRRIDGQNLRLNASFSDSYSSDTRVRTTAEVGGYVSEGSTGNWAAEARRFGSLNGCRIAPASCDSNMALWLKVMFKASENRTFVISGNISETGAPTATSCTSFSGEEGIALAVYAPAFAYIFANATADGGLRLNCVGAGSLWQRRDRFGARVGPVMQAVYTGAPPQFNVPAGAPPPRFVVAESASADGDDIPISLEGITLPSSVDSIGDHGSVTRPSADLPELESFSVHYTDWDSNGPPVPPEYWVVPGMCFASGGTGWAEGDLEAERRHAAGLGRGRG